MTAETGTYRWMAPEVVFLPSPWSRGGGGEGDGEGIKKINGLLFT